MIDFFKPECKSEIEDTQFGICDGINDNPAFITKNTNENWTAHVDNSSSMKIFFHAIDGCIEMIRDNGENETRCDVMLTYTDGIVFIELKEVRTGGWIQGGIEQLEIFIQIFRENFDLSSIKKRRAFLTNGRNPSFKYSHKEGMEKFKVRTSVRLIIHNKIKI